MLFVLPEIQDRFGFGVNNVAALILVLSKDGTQPVFYSEAQIAKKVRCSKRLVTKTKQILKQGGYIEITTFLNEQSEKYTRIDVLEKLVNAKFFKDEDKKNYSTECHTSIAQDAIPIAQNTKGYSTECQGVSHNVLRGIAQNANKKEVIKEVIKKERKQFIGGNVKKTDAEDWLNQPQVNDYDDYFVGEETKEDPLSLNATTTAGAVVEKKSCAKRKETKKFSIPTTDAVASLICEWANKHIASYPQLQRLDVNLEAENFCAYWESKDWRRRGERIKSLNGTIATWLINALKYGTIAVKSANPVNDFRRTGLTREMNQQIADNMTAKASAFADLLKGNVPKKQGNVLELKGDAQ